jgi:hypothetical protein
MRRLQVQRTGKSCSLHDPDCAFRSLLFQSHFQYDWPLEHQLLFEKVVSQLRANHGMEQLTKQTPSCTFVLQRESKGGACKCVSWRGMNRSCLQANVHYVHLAFISCISCSLCIYFWLKSTAIAQLPCLLSIVV